MDGWEGFWGGAGAPRRLSISFHPNVWRLNSSKVPAATVPL